MFFFCEFQMKTVEILHNNVTIFDASQKDVQTNLRNICFTDLGNNSTRNKWDFQGIPDEFKIGPLRSIFWNFDFYENSNSLMSYTLH